MITIKAPASSANLGPGFDTLGLSLGIFNILEADKSNESRLVIEGEGSDYLSSGHENLVLRSVAIFYKEILNSPPPKLDIKMVNNIPVSRGMGSSAATIVSGIALANEISERGLTRDELFVLASKIEGHPDNVAASIYGGMTIAYSDVFGNHPKASSFLPQEELRILLLIPGAGLSTLEARGTLPEKIGYRDATFNLSRVALLIKTFLSGDLNLLGPALEDKLHQPYRMKLMPDLEKTIEICDKAGAYGAALSGAGPTIIAFTSLSQREAVMASIKEGLKNSDLEFTVIPYDIDKDGVKVEKK